MTAPSAPPQAGRAARAPGLTVAATARRLGVAPGTLRTWDRRYGLGPSSHAAGAHRRYGPADLARLETMRRLVLSGVAPGDAARSALAETLPAGEVPVAEPTRPRRGGPGGRVLALPGADAVVKGLGRAAMALDSAAVLASVREQLAEHGVITTWEHVLRPVLAAAGAHWQATGSGVEVEHLLSDCITVALREVTGPTVTGARPVLLASGPGEQHALPLHAVAAALAERGTASRVLGASLPEDALCAAVCRTGAAGVFVWSQFSSTAAPAALADLPVTRPPTAVVVGGPGWRAHELPGRVRLAADLPEAVALLDTAGAGAAGHATGP